MTDANPKSLVANHPPDEALAHDRELAILAAWTADSVVLEDEHNVPRLPYDCSTLSEALIPTLDLTVTPDGSTRVLAEAGCTGMCCPPRKRLNDSVDTASQTGFIGLPPGPRRQRPQEEVTPTGGAQWTPYTD